LGSDKTGLHQCPLAVDIDTAEQGAPELDEAGYEKKPKQ
tara:strand:+ start:453 stop:569 length:117 start_codon:yes stop_codon:yes gene_type:complete